MTKHPNPLYGITVHITDHTEEGMGREEWRAELHRTVHLESTVNREIKHEYDREELRAAFQWCAGVLARVALSLGSSVRHQNDQDGHECLRFTERNRVGIRCGIGWEEGVTALYSGPRWAVDSELVVPEVELYVPTERADHWLKVTRRCLAGLLADDLKPLDALGPTPGHQVRATLTTQQAQENAP